MFEKIATTADGKEIYFDNENSHAITHLEKNPLLRLALEKIIPTLDLTDKINRLEIDTKEVVGNCDLVETEPRDKIVYAKRPLR